MTGPSRSERLRQAGQEATDSRPEVRRVEACVPARVAIAGDTVDIAAVDDPGAAAGASRHVADARNGGRAREAVGEGVAAEPPGIAGPQRLALQGAGRVAEDLKAGEARPSGRPFAGTDDVAEDPQPVRLHPDRGDVEVGV